MLILFLLFQTEPVRYSVELRDLLGAYFFTVDANSGLLTIRTSLTAGSALSYIVSHHKFSYYY